MNSSSLQAVALTCHPDTPCRAVRKIGVQLRRAADNRLELQYSLEGDVAGLRIPATTAARRADSLWKHTCFEAFVGEDDVTLGYREFNFAPSTEWAIYQFSGYRAGMTVVDIEHAPAVSVQHETDCLMLTALIDLEPLSNLDHGPVLRLALSAVVEETDSRVSYWALAHPPGRPDFHHADGFVVTLVRADPHGNSKI